MSSQAATVLVTDYAWPSLAIEQEILGAAGARVVAATTGAEDELVRLAPEADIILTCWQQVTAAVLDAAPRCRAVGRYGIGLDNIAVDHATALGMLVTNVPDFCLEEVSDHALALLLACARRIVLFARATQSGVWNLAAGQPIPRLRGQTLGLIGYGGIARTLAPKAQALGLRVLAYTPRLASGPLDASTTGTNDLNELLAASDFVSIHVPLTDETRGLLDARALRQMKPTAYLINTSRGAVIDEAALCPGARRRADRGCGTRRAGARTARPRPSAAAVAKRHPHATRRLLLRSGDRRLQRQAAEQAAAVLRGELPPNIVNPAVLQQPNYRAGTR